jgi:hypothetical protein
MMHVYFFFDLGTYTTCWGTSDHAIGIATEVCYIATTQDRKTTFKLTLQLILQTTQRSRAKTKWRSLLMIPRFFDTTYIGHLIE